MNREALWKVVSEMTVSKSKSWDVCFKTAAYRRLQIFLTFLILLAIISILLSYNIVKAEKFYSESNGRYIAITNPKWLQWAIYSIFVA